MAETQLRAVHQERKKASGQQVRREHRQQLSIRGRLQQQQRGGGRGALPAPTPNQVQGKAQGMRAASRASTEEGGAPSHGILCCSIQNPANILNLSRERLTHQDSSAHHTASPCLSLSLWSYFLPAAPTPSLNPYREVHAPVLVEDYDSRSPISGCCPSARLRRAGSPSTPLAAPPLACRAVHLPPSALQPVRIGSVGRKSSGRCQPGPATRRRPRPCDRLHLLAHPNHPRRPRPPRLRQPADHFRTVTGERGRKRGDLLRMEPRWYWSPSRRCECRPKDSNAYRPRILGPTTHLLTSTRSRPLKFRGKRVGGPRVALQGKRTPTLLLSFAAL